MNAPAAPLQAEKALEGRTLRGFLCRYSIRAIRLSAIHKGCCNLPQQSPAAAQEQPCGKWAEQIDKRSQAAAQN